MAYWFPNWRTGKTLPKMPLFRSLVKLLSTLLPFRTTLMLRLRLILRLKLMLRLRLRLRPRLILMLRSMLRLGLWARGERRKKFTRATQVLKGSERETFRVKFPSALVQLKACNSYQFSSFPCRSVPSPAFQLPSLSFSFLFFR